MKCIIAGSRKFHYMYKLEEVILKSGFDITEVVCGLSRGVDELGWIWATANNIPIKEFPAEWGKYGRAAGPIRNEQMAEYGDALICLMYEDSRGSANMVKCMRDLGKPYYVEILTRE